MAVAVCAIAALLTWVTVGLATCVSVCCMTEVVLTTVVEEDVRIWVTVEPL